jgi:hypothetical protein
MLFDNLQDELARLDRELAAAKKYRPKIRYRPARPRPRQQPEYRYVVETGCANLGTCNEDCRACSDEQHVRWVAIGMLTALYPGRSASLSYRDVLLSDDERERAECELGLAHEINTACPIDNQQRS